MFDKQAKIIVFSVLYMLGIIAFLSSHLLLISVFVFSSLIFCLLYKKIFSVKLFFVYSLLFLFSVFYTSLSVKHYDDLTSYDGESVSVLAKIISIPTNNIKEKTKFYADVISLTEDGKTTNLKAKSLITINDKNEKLEKIKIGNILEITGTLKVPATAQNPSQFDYAKYLQYKKIFSLIYTNEDWKIVRNSGDFYGKILQKLNDKRNEILKIHAQNIKSPMLEVLGGIIFGDDAVNPDENTKSDFINSGIFHILAASGMNVTLIFGIWFFFARRLKLNYKFSIITGILLILFYTCMTGFGPPIIRASLMLTFILLGKLIDRKTSTMALLFMVGFIMLLINPLMLFDIGFQMSFIVTFALILSAPLLVFDFKHKVIANISGACLIPVIAQLYAAPLQMFYFNTFSLYSVFANIAIIPVLSIVSFLGFISSIIAMIPVISYKICKIADILLNPLLVYITKIANIFANLPFSIADVKKPMLIQIILYFMILISITLIFRYSIKSKKIISCFSLLCLFFALTFVPFSDKKAEIIFFSVGNADMIMIKSPDNQYFMVDTGKTSYKNSSTQAKNITVKYLKDRGIKSLNSLILTHYDADHAGGTIDILKNINTTNLYLTDVIEDSKLSENINNYIIEHNVNKREIKENINIYSYDGFKITILKPVGQNLITENQKSLVVFCEYKGNKVLLMGDGDIHSYNALNDSFKKDVKALKIGHHGGINTINNEMISNTEFFVISTGKNIYNHPHSSTLQLLEKENASYYRTDYHNALKLVLSPKNIDIYLFSPKFKKFIKQ